jgi:hypothetical protein
MIVDFNLDNWPIVYFKLNNNEINETSFDEYKRYYLNLLIKCKNNNEKMVLICNLNNSTNMPLSWVMKQAQFNKEIQKHNKDYVKTVCIMCKEKSFKNILNLYFSVSKPAAPYKLCRSYEKVNKYLLEKFNITFDSRIYGDELFQETTEEENCEEENNDIEYIESQKTTVHEEFLDSEATEAQMMNII